MAINSDGSEGSVQTGGQTFMEMEPHVWYPIAALTSLENQLMRPLLVSEVEPPTIVQPITWPSPHFREVHTMFTIQSGEKMTLGVDAFIMSTHWRLQPITECLMSQLPDMKAILAPVAGQIPREINHEEYYLCDITDGKEVIKEVHLFDDGTKTIEYYKEGIQVTLSSNFQAKAPNTETEYEIMFETDPTTGEVVEIREIRQTIDNVTQPFTYSDSSGVAYVPTNGVAPSPFRVMLTPEAVTATGTTGIALSTIPTFAQYAEVYINVESGNAPSVRWTIDSTDPAANNGEQELAGTTIRLYDRSQIDGFRVVPADDQGAVDGTQTATMKVSYWNIDPGED